MSLAEAIIGGTIGGVMPTIVSYLIFKKQLTAQKAVEKKWAEYQLIITELSRELNRVKTWWERPNMAEIDLAEIGKGSGKTRETIREMATASLFISEETKNEIENYLKKQLILKQKADNGEHTIKESYKNRVSLLDETITKLREFAKKEMGV